jgi:hypothetical protein
MSSLVLAIVGLLAAGFAFGTWRLPALPRSGIGIALAIAAVGVPPATLLLAKLFGSDVLGWIFGLMLLAALALVPGAAVFWLGTRLGARFAGARRGPPVAAAPPFSVDVERDGVHASDDAPCRRLVIEPGMSIGALLGLALADGYLPAISGGRASWVAESGAGRPIAVLAQQWAEPAFLVAPDTTAAAHFDGQAARLVLRYRRQEDPQAVLAALSRGAR